MFAAIGPTTTAGHRERCRAWSYSNVLPYFRKSENWEGGGDNYHGSGGPLATRKSRYQDPLVDAYLEAAQAAGYAFNDDYNGAKQDGFARMQMTVRNGRRESAATAYLHPVLARENLSVAVNAQVTRVLLEGSRAVGVEYLKDGEKHSVEASREVILCGGSINSPQVLMLSGIGDGDALRALGIPVKARLPGVGKNLQDHVAALLVYGRRDESPLLRNMRLDRLALDLAERLRLRQGLRNRTSRRHHRLCEKRPGRTDTRHTASFPRRFADGSALFAAVQAAVCRQFRLPRRSAAAGKPRRDHAGIGGSVGASAHFPSLLSTDADWKKLRNAIQIFRDLARSRQIARFVSSEIEPGADVATDAAA